MHISDLDYDLPGHLIAQHPADPRDSARLMVVDRLAEEIYLDRFSNLPGYLDAGDVLVLNDTKVIRARLYGTKPSGGRVELFLLQELTQGVWRALVKPSARVKPGTEIRLPSGMAARVMEALSGGARRVCFDEADVLGYLERSGEIPLPPYIARGTPDASDLTRYQTVYAEKPGAVAAPTAGLHYTPEVFEALSERGIERATLTLHVGYGTFKPIQSEEVTEHVVDSEVFCLPEETVQTLNRARQHGRRIVAAGTTVTRVLETQCAQETFFPGEGETSLYIYPPYRFGGVDVLQTNFHLPRSSLLALVYAFGGTALMRRAYERAVAEEMRFYSYGDTMLIL